MIYKWCELHLAIYYKKALPLKKVLQKKQ